MDGQDKDEKARQRHEKTSNSSDWVSVWARFRVERLIESHVRKRQATWMDRMGRIKAKTGSGFAGFAG